MFISVESHGAKDFKNGLYFTKKLQNKWNEWLSKKYTTDEAIIKAWGKVTPGKSRECFICPQSDYSK